MQINGYTTEMKAKPTVGSDSRKMELEVNSVLALEGCMVLEIELFFPAFCGPSSWKHGATLIDTYTNCACLSHVNE